MKRVEWHEALLAIENEDVIVVLIHDGASSSQLLGRLASFEGMYSRRGYNTLVVRVDEDCASHPELAAVRLPQIRVFADGVMSAKHVGVVGEDILQELV